MKERIYLGLFLESITGEVRSTMNMGSRSIGTEALDPMLPACKANVTTHPPHTSASMPSIVIDCKSPNKNDAITVFQFINMVSSPCIWILFSSFY